MHELVKLTNGLLKETKSNFCFFGLTICRRETANSERGEEFSLVRQIEEEERFLAALGVTARCTHARLLELTLALAGRRGFLILHFQFVHHLLNVGHLGGHLFNFSALRWGVDGTP